MSLFNHCVEIFLFIYLFIAALVSYQLSFNLTIPGANYSENLETDTVFNTSLNNLVGHNKLCFIDYIKWDSWIYNSMVMRGT